MIVRALDAQNDFTFGKGKSNYITGNLAVAQNLSTRLRSFLGNCFFDIRAGIDWFNLLGSKNQIGLNLAISSVILNTEFVIGIVQLGINLSSATRKQSVQYAVRTVFNDTIRASLDAQDGILLTEDGNPLTTEDDDPLEVE